MDATRHSNPTPKWLHESVPHLQDWGILFRCPYPRWLTEGLLWNPTLSLSARVIAFFLFAAAHYAEIIRAGISCVRSGQIAAGRAIGLSYPQTMRYIVLPQAFRCVLPVSLTQAIVLFQDTSLVYVVGLKYSLVSAKLMKTPGLINR